jgi:hypothetical protein
MMRIPSFSRAISHGFKSRMRMGHFIDDSWQISRRFMSADFPKCEISTNFVHSHDAIRHTNSLAPNGHHGINRLPKQAAAIGSKRRDLQVSRSIFALEP